FPLPLSMISFASFLFHSYADLRALHSFPTRRSSDLAVSRTLTLFTYKLRFFFGPALRGRFGPLAYFGLILIFLPSGFAFGVSLGDRKSTRLNSSHVSISYAVFCLKKKNTAVATS